MYQPPRRPYDLLYMPVIAFVHPPPVVAKQGGSISTAKSSSSNVAAKIGPRRQREFS